MRESLRIMMLLLAREVCVMMSSWRAIMFSAAVFSLLLACSSRFFLPLMGMAESYVVPLFLGSFIVSCVSIGYSCCLEVAYDLKSPQLIRYYSMLPASFGIVVAAQVISIVMRIVIIAIPVLLGGLCIINKWSILAISPLSILSIVVSSALFNALFFLILAYWCSIPMLLGNVWPRVLSPLFALGCVLYPWRTVVAHSPVFANVLLCNPMTYCIEGLRTACLGGDQFLSLTHCMSVLIGVNSILSVIVWIVAVRAVKPVCMHRSFV